jgi:hypothetical protein
MIINELALDPVGEITLVEDSDSVTVQRDVLLKVFAAWSA